MRASGVKRLRHPFELAVWLSAMLLLLSAVSGFAADEDALVALWKLHMSAADEHETVIKACRSFAASHAADPLLPVARGIETWRTLRAGNRNEALAMWEADLALPPSPMNDCARRVAAGWLSRADREKVVSALHAYYRKEVAYPKELAQIAAHPRLKINPPPPDTDRFGKPWSYLLTGFEKLKGFPDQKYTLRSMVLGDSSDLNAAEKLPYGSRIVAVPQRVIAMPDNTSAVGFQIGASSLLSLLGPGSGDLHLAFIGTKIVVVCDHTHWKLLPRP